jgi:hypothetical protein
LTLPLRPLLFQSPHERKFDSFAFLLSDEFLVQQIDASDVLADGLRAIDTLVLPGGLVADYETHLGLSPFTLTFNWFRTGRTKEDL